MSIEIMTRMENEIQKWRIETLNANKQNQFSFTLFVRFFLFIVYTQVQNVNGVERKKKNMGKTKARKD